MYPDTRCAVLNPTTAILVPSGDMVGDDMSSCGWPTVRRTVPSRSIHTSVRPAPDHVLVREGPVVRLGGPGSDRCEAERFADDFPPREVESGRPDALLTADALIHEVTGGRLREEDAAERQRALRLVCTFDDVHEVLAALPQIDQTAVRQRAKIEDRVAVACAFDPQGAGRSPPSGTANRLPVPGPWLM